MFFSHLYIQKRLNQNELRFDARVFSFLLGQYSLISVFDHMLGPFISQLSSDLRPFAPVAQIELNDPPVLFLVPLSTELVMFY